MPLGWPYQQGPVTGVHGPPNSNHNFCEEDYIITPYIAEFVNTLTNLTYVIYGAHGIRRVRHREDGGLFSTLAFPYWGLVGVGVLSAWFHITLKYHSQMGDDLSMFLAVGALLHQLTTFNSTPTQRLKTTLLILGTLIPASIYHVWADEIYVHELVFAIMILLVVRQARRLIRERVTNPESQKRLGSMAIFGLGSGLFGYFLWNIDFHLCSHVTAFKRELGLPWALVFELHGWWHILTGIGAYTGMALVEYLVTLEEGRTDRIEEGFVWPVRAVLRNLEGSEAARKAR
ncbi:alkaline ceramidase family protein [Massariosphaeria phaeospora]|uniref:Alkaline ceramidase family protein n=1 Tax=Massariosphaeria phaeospora TaxID=100035 RepID=A0A7C8I1K0_9PLEO|nr:alkaline ceramidase family protein [Massariosphaeria phaeospora]